MNNINLLIVNRNAGTIYWSKNLKTVSRKSMLNTGGGLEWFVYWKVYLRNVDLIYCQLYTIHFKSLKHNLAGSNHYCHPQEITTVKAFVCQRDGCFQWHFSSEVLLESSFQIFPECVVYEGKKSKTVKQ